VDQEVRASLAVLLRLEHLEDRGALEVRAVQVDLGYLEDLVNLAYPAVQVRPAFLEDPGFRKIRL
jgi:hypothetical protein